MKRIAITGVSGFVGANLLPYLKERGVDTMPLSRTFGPGYDAVDAVFLNQQSVYGIVHLAGKAHDLRKEVNSAEYYEVNTELTKRLFDAFLESDSEVFVYLSSVKAIADRVEGALTETHIPKPLTDYGKSKLAAETYLQQAILPPRKRVYILRPCMIHGPGNKGNLNLLYQVVKRGIPYPLAAFDNQRSFLSVENLCFVIQELLQRKDIAPGVYHIADDQCLSTNQVVEIISDVLGKRKRLIAIPASWIRAIARAGNYLPLPLNTERLQKLTEDYVVDNRKLIEALQKKLPVDAGTGLKKTISSFTYVD